MGVSKHSMGRTTHCGSDAPEQCSALLPGLATNTGGADVSGESHRFEGTALKGEGLLAPVALTVDAVLVLSNEHCLVLLVSLGGG